MKTERTMKELDTACNAGFRKLEELKAAGKDDTGAAMTICAKFDGRPVSQCTRGDRCICLKEQQEFITLESGKCRHPQCRDDAGDCRGVCAEMDKLYES